VQNVTVSGSSGANLSSISNSSEAMTLDDNPPNDKESEKSSINRKGKKMKGRSYKTSTAAFGKVHFSKDSKRTPSQVIKADKERKEAIAQLEKAYEWAVSQAPKHQNKAELARMASDLFNVTVAPQTVRRLIKEGRKKIVPPGRKSEMDDEELQNIGAALCSFVAICQVNGDPEKKRKDLIAALELLLNGNGTSNPTTLFKRVKKENAGLLELSKKHVIEMRRLLWTTPKNLNDWFDEWGLFCVAKGFATRSEHDGEVVFSEAQKRRIINIDETNLSLDGSDGGRGGRPASTITIKHY